MTVKICIDGTLHDPDTARVSVLDRGFLYGDSVFEAMRTSGGHPVAFDRHLDRLERSARAIMLTLPPRSFIAEASARTLSAAGNPESYLRIVITRGVGEFGLDPALSDRSCLVVIVRPLSLPPARFYQHGLAVHIVGVQRTPRRAVDPAVKSGNYLNNILALHEGRQHGADEALMCNASGHVAEGSTSNIFVVHGSEVMTPALEVGLLAGITRSIVLDLAHAEGLATVERNLTPDEVRGADEAFITSSVRGVVPVATIDGQPLQRPAVGPTTRRIMDRYEAYLEDVAHGRDHTVPHRSG